MGSIRACNATQRMSWCLVAYTALPHRHSVIVCMTLMALRVASWDRQPFIHDTTGSLTPKFNTIEKNFLFSNYGSGFGVDNDDTSSYYNITSNVFYMGGGVKCGKRCSNSPCAMDAPCSDGMRRTKR